MGDDCDCLNPTLPIPPPEFHKQQKKKKNTHKLSFPCKWEITKYKVNFFLSEAISIHSQKDLG